MSANRIGTKERFKNLPKANVSIDRVILFNFRTFLGRHEVSFPATGVVCLDGDNRDTGGKSAAGKSNLLLAISYAMGHCPFSAKALQSWESDDPFYVELHLSTYKGSAVIVRGPKGTSLTIGDDKVTGAKAVEEGLQKLLGVSPDLREVLTYRDQQYPTSFMAMTDLEMKTFLVSVLGLESLEEEVRAAAKVVAAAKQELEKREELLGLWRTSNQDRLTEPPPVVLEVFDDSELKQFEFAIVVLDDEVARLEREIGEVKRSDWLRIEEANAEADKIISDLERQIAQVNSEPFVVDDSEVKRLEGVVARAAEMLREATAGEVARRKEFDADKDRLLVKVFEHASVVVEAPGLRKAAEALRGQIKKLEDSRCAMCGRQWDQAIVQAESLRQDLNQIEVRLQKVVVADRAREELKQQADAMEFVPDPEVEKLRAAAGAVSEKLAAEKARLRSAQGEHSKDVERRVATIRAGVSVAKAEKSANAANILSNSVVTDLNSVLEIKKGALIKTKLEKSGAERVAQEVSRRNAAAHVAYQHAMNEYEKANKKLGQLGHEVVQANDLLARETDFRDMVVGFRNKIFDEILGEVGAEASEILSRLSNARSVAIDFVSERETASGTTENKIRAVARFNGDERPLKDSVSGGQRTSISLAVDLALSRVISRRMGCRLDWIILDESFSFQDNLTKEACVEMLREYALDKLVVTVDHGSEMKELMGRKITVRLENGRSSIVDSD